MFRFVCTVYSNITINKSNLRVLVNLAKITCNAEQQLNRFACRRINGGLWMFLDDCKTFKQNTSLRMSSYEEKITAAIRQKPNKAETACNITLKRNRLANDEPAKNHTATTQNYESIEIKYVPRIKWLDFSAQLFIHGGCLYGLYLVLTQAKLLTSLWGKATIFFVHMHLFYRQLYQFFYLNILIEIFI